MLVCPKCGSTYTREQEHCGLDGSKLVQSDEDPLLGKTIDKYHIEARLGSGGMANVYRARHQFLDKDYAIKVLHGQIAADSTMARRFQREAKTLGQIKHPNVVSVDNFGATTAGLLYMVMEFVDGPTLAQVLKSQGPLAPGRAAEIVRQIATGLQAAHRKGFVHRDLKPGNVMLRLDDVEGDSIKLMDFGLVRILTPDADQTQLTQDGQFFGTPMYMAPEQITGNPVGPFTDLYALGVMLYQMLSGKPPFLGDVKKLAYQHVQVAPEKLSSPFGGLSELTHRLLKKNPKDRPSDAANVIASIDELALTPVSRPMRRRGSSLDGPNLHDTLDDVGRREEPALSRPILLEERAFRTAHEADPELKASIDQALGSGGSRTRFLLALLVLLVSIVGGIYIANGFRFELDAIQALLSARKDSKERLLLAPDGAREDSAPGRLPPPGPTGPTTALKPPPPTTSDWITGSADAPDKANASGRDGSSGSKAPTVAPPATVPTRADAGEASAAAPGRTDAGAVEAPAIEPTTEPDAGPSSAPRPFLELDAALGRALASRGISFDDLIDAEDDAVERWQRWQDLEDSERPPADRIQAVYRSLDDAIHTLPIDDALLRRKLERADGDLRILKAINAEVPPSRIAQLRRRLDRAEADIRRKPRRKSPQALAAEITAIETAIAEAGEPPPTNDRPPRTVIPTATAATSTSDTP